MAQTGMHGYHVSPCMPVWAMQLRITYSHVIHSNVCGAYAVYSKSTVICTPIYVYQFTALFNYMKI